MDLTLGGRASIEVVPPAESVVIPAGLLQAVASRSGRVSLVVGAGCSVEPPTSLKVGSQYSIELHTSLVADGVLSQGECDSPEDLSELTSCVFRKVGSQSAVVQRMPRGAFRYAKANNGYLAAAALLCEGSVNCIATLNYDLALTDAVRQLGATEVEEVSGPGGLQHFGTKAIIYLHRNVNEPDDEKWILRKEALDDEWRDSWESVVVARIVASPVTVFAGLGSPAAVLTETVARVRRAVPDGLEAFLVDPSEKSTFADALGITSANQVRAEWGAFMTNLSARVADQARSDLRQSCRELCLANGWADTEEAMDSICSAFSSVGLVSMGLIRSKWLCSERIYEPDNPARRPLIADLLLALALLRGNTETEIQFHDDGSIRVGSSEVFANQVVLISGCGHRRWSQIDALLSALAVTSASPHVVIAGGFQGPRQSDLTPPAHIVDGEPSDDVTQGRPAPRVIAIDGLRANPAAFPWNVA